MTIGVFLGSLIAAMALGIPIAYALLLSGVALMWRSPMVTPIPGTLRLISGASFYHGIVAVLARIGDPVDGPIIQLAGFQRVHLEPGESHDLSFTVGRDQLRMLDAKMKWVVEPGTFRILVGSSSKDLRLRGDLIVQ